jgi:hypothetical protein
MVMDGCATGISGVVSQGKDWKNARVVVFYSAKLNSAQQNYLVHEIELMARIEIMLHHTDILQGVQFKWVTDHKGLTHLLNQKNLSGRQARWLEKISSFDFEVVYIPENKNVLVDALSRLYSYNSPGTVRAKSEYAYLDVMDNNTMTLSTMSQKSSIPMLAGIEAHMMTLCHPPRPELSREFVRWMVGRFVLCGPQDQKEGESTAQITQLASTSTDEMLDIVPDDGPSSADSPLSTDGSGQQTLMLINLTMSTEGINLVDQIRHQYQYETDTLFGLILRNPAQFWNFEMENGLVHLKEQGKKLLCIPKIIIEG